MELPRSFVISITMNLLTVTLILCVAAASAAPSRIHGGEYTTIERYPYIVQVEGNFPPDYIWQHWCGASILNEMYLLSAAHCFYGPLYETTRRRIRAGTTYSQVGGTVIYIEREIHHPSFDFFTADGDVTVILLSSPLTMSHVIQPASIVRQGWVIPDSVRIVTVGWGATETQSYSPILQHATTLTINWELCNHRYSTHDLAPRNLTKNMFCSGLLDVGGKGGCSGDSGGPLYFQNIVIGLSSWGYGCADPIYPIVSVNVASYTDWILETSAI